MTSSGHELGLPSGADAALGYDAAGKPGHELALRDLPAGGLNTTVLDLLRFARLFCAPDGAKAVISAASLAEMVRPQNAACPLDLDLRVGLGWQFAPAKAHGGSTVLFHGGGTLHPCSMLKLKPCMTQARAFSESNRERQIGSPACCPAHRTRATGMRYSAGTGRPAGSLDDQWSRYAYRRTTGQTTLTPESHPAPGCARRGRGGLGAGTEVGRTRPQPPRRPGSTCAVRSPSVSQT